MSNDLNGFLFEDNNLEHRNATINWRDSPLDEFHVYADRYHNAAEKLMNELLDQPSFHDMDPCPIVFLYRHSIELYLKAVCLVGYDLFQVKDKELLMHGAPLEKEKLFKNHKLLPLIEVIKQVFDELGWSWDLEDKFEYFKSYENFKSALNEIDSIDSGSYTFRYPYDKNESAASLTKGFSFNLILFQERVNILISALDGMSTQLGIDLNSALEEKYCQQQLEAEFLPQQDELT